MKSQTQQIGELPLASAGSPTFEFSRRVLEARGKEEGAIGLKVAEARNRFQDATKLRRVIVGLIDAENWPAMGADVKGDAYEGQLERNAQDSKSDAGQYITLPALIKEMVGCIALKPGERIDVVLANPPFGKKSSMMIVKE